MASGGNATGSALAAKTIVGTIVPTSSGGALTVFDFASPATVAAGSTYVIVMTTPDSTGFGGGGSYRWYFLDGNSYADGNGIANPKTAPSSLSDFVFQTYVDVE